MGQMILNQTYRIDSELDRGGMSVVYRGWHLRLNKQVAIKRVSDTDSRFDFMAEANILKNLDHAMLPRIYDIFQDDKYVYIVMDFIEGESLDKVIAREKVIDEKTVRKWFREICDVLKYLHDQKPYPVIYRDMKPSNIMLQSDGRLKLIDFGIAKLYQDPTAKVARGGTRGYGAPEQFAKGGVTDARTDIYSLGQTMFHFATGKSPLVKPYPPYMFDARAYNPNVSQGLAHILDKCMQEIPEQRYQNVDELIYDLDHIYEFEDSYKAFRKKKKGRRALASILLTAGILLTIGGIFMMQKDTSSEYQSLIAQAEEAEEEQALSLVQQAQKLLPEETAAYDEELNIYYKNASYQNVIDCYQEFINDGTITSADANASVLAAASYYELGDYEKAADLYSGISILSTDNTLSYAASLAQLGEKDKALEVISKVKNTADTAQSDYLEGEIYLLNDEYKEAVESFQKVMGESTDDSLTRQCVLSITEAWRDSYALGEGNEEYIEDANTQIIDTINKAMQNPTMSANGVLWERLGRAYYLRAVNGDMSRDDLTASANAYQKELDLGINKDYLYLNIYAAYEAAGMYDASGAILSKMKEAFPDEADPYIFNATRLIKIEGEKPEGERNYSEAYAEYQTAETKNVSSEAQAQMELLRSMIQDLKDKGWLA